MKMSPVLRAQILELHHQGAHRRQITALTHATRYQVAAVLREYYATPTTPTRKSVSAMVNDPNSHDHDDDQQQPRDDDEELQATTPARQVKPFGESTIFGTFVFGDPEDSDTEEN